MIARFHYDDETLGQLLRDESADDYREIAEHVETCDQCQDRLEAITQQGLTWEQAGELLRYDPLDEPVGLSFDAFDSITGETFLVASDHPESLGRFGRYEIMEFLGCGGMGIVMRGFDPALNRHSAIKVLAPVLASSAAARKRFSREAKSAAAVVHPHVVPIQTVDEHNGLPYLVMPVVEGKSLQQRVDQSGPLPIVESVRIAAQIAEGLAAAHAQGLVHRDIKPANILLENGVERVQITDFGLARAADDASMTRSGVIAGTPQYMSPEQAHGDEIDHRSDLFSLGSVMYFMLTGRSPFRAENTMGVLHRIVNDEPRRLRSINPAIPTWLQSIVMRLLEKSPDKRFASAESTAQELNRRLAQLQDPSDDGTEPKSSARRQVPPPVKWVALASVLVAAILYLTVVVLQTKDGTIRIEANGELDEPIPLVVKQGDEVVERLTVDSEGGTTRVRAGSYIIEFDGEKTSFELVNNRATVTAGGVWTTKIEYHKDDDSWKSSSDPNDVRSLAIEDATYGRYEAALEKTLWYWDNAVKIQPSLSAVRRSFLLSDWLALGENYPPALEKLKATRDSLETRILSKDQVRVRDDDFADFATINRTLRQDDRTHQVFEKIKERSKQDAERLRFWLPKTPGTSTPEATLDLLHRSSLLDPPGFPAQCFADEALLELGGVMLQSLTMLSGFSQIGAQAGGVVGTEDGVPIMVGTPPSFHLQVQELLDKHTLKEPPEVSKKAFELLAKLTLGAVLSEEESGATPDRELFRLAAGILKSPKEFIPAASRLQESFGVDDSPASEASIKSRTLPKKWNITVVGDTATATAVTSDEHDSGDSSDPPTTMKLRKINGQWLVSECLSDEVLARLQASISGTSGGAGSNESDDEDN